jgi:predicted TIM-barrel fold metal-dependent hydrolase
MPDFSVIDVDGHVMEPEEIWIPRLAPEFHAFAPRRVIDNQGRIRQFVGGELKQYIPMPPGAGTPLPGGFDGKARLEDMDRQGVECSILYPTTGLFFGGIRNADVQIALCRAYNDWLHEFCSADPKRLRGVAAVPQLDIGECVRETERAVRDLDFCAVMLRPNTIGGRNIDDPGYDPLWEALERFDVPAGMHEGTTQDLPQSGDRRFDNFMFRHACTHPHEQQMAVMEFTCGGVLDRHPKLRVVFLESGCGWIAHWLERLDEHVEAWGFASLKPERMPSQAFADQCFVSADPNEKIIPGLVDVIGDESIVFATDYPHPDAVAGDMVGEITRRENLSDESKRHILHDNALRLFNFA